MSDSRNRLKRIIYRFLGKKIYQKAYVRGKIKDIKSGKNLENEALFLSHFVKPDSTVLDIGANYGHYTVELSKINPQGHIYAFEPVPFTFEVLQKVLDHFNLKNVTLLNAAVSNNEGSVEMIIPLLDFGAPNTGVAYVGNSTGTANQSARVNTIRIDDQTIQGRVDFIKMDIEGHEPLAMEGMEKLMAVHLPVILIEFSFGCLRRAGFDPAEFSNQISQRYGYGFYSLKDKKIVRVNSTSPGDGYYFLIPEQRRDEFKHVMEV